MEMMRSGVLLMVLAIGNVRGTSAQSTGIVHAEAKDASAMGPLHSREFRDGSSLSGRDEAQPVSRVKRQLTYFFLTMMGKKGIQAFVENTSPELMPSLIDPVGPDEILYIVSCLEDHQIMRVLNALPPASILKLSKKLTSDQLMELLSYVPAWGLAELTAAFSSEELKQLVVLLPPEGIVNMTRTLPPEQTLKMIRSMPPEAVINMTRTLPPETLTELMTALPPWSMVPVLTSFPPQAIQELVTNLPPGFLQSFVTGLSPAELAQIVQNVTDRQMMKLLTSFPVEYAPNVSSLLRPEVINAVLDSLPKDLVGNLTTLLPPEMLSDMISAVPEDTLLMVASMVSPKQVVDIVSSIPSASWPTLLKAVPPDLLATVTTSLPVDNIVNITVALAERPGVMTAMLTSLMSPQLVDLASNASRFFPRDIVLEILEKLPNDTFGKLAAAFPVRKAFAFVKSFSGELAGFNVTELLQDIPEDLLKKVVTAVPPEVIADLSSQLTTNQLKKMIRLVTPDLLKVLTTLVPPKVMIDITASLPESVMSKVLQVLSPSHFRNLVKAIPIATMQSLVTEMLSADRVAVSSERLLAGTRKIANILNSVPPETVTRLIKAIPRDVLVDVINSLPADVMARAAAIMAGEEGGPMLLQSMPLEAPAYAVSIIPPETIAKMVDAVPSRTISAFGAHATHVPKERIVRFFKLVRVGTLKNIITKLPPRVIQKLASSIPPEAVGRMALTFTPVSVTPFMESLRPRDLRRLIRSVNTSTLTNLVTAIPQDVIVNLTEALPAPQLRKLVTAVPPAVIGHLVNYLDPDVIVVLMKAMPPEVVENMMNAMPAEVLVNMTRALPAAQLQEMIDVLPDKLIGQMVSLLPADVMADLVRAFEAEALLGMMQKVETSQLMDILSKLPHKVLLDMTLSLTPAQTVTLLRSIPPDSVVNLTYVIPTDVMMEMMQAVPPEALIGVISSMPLKDIIALVAQLTPQQMAQAMEQMTSDPDLLPNLLASFDLDRLVSMAEAVPFDLLLELSSVLDLPMAQDLIERLLPKGKEFLKTLLDKGLDALDTNSTQTFHACLQDVSLVAHGLFNSSQWAFHFPDASGKPGRGMLEGNIHMMGNYDQCKRIRHVLRRGPREGDVIAGSYCHVQFDIPLEHLPPIPGDGVLPMPEIAIDLCVPDTCLDFDIHNLLKKVKLPMNMSIPRVSCQQDMDILQDPAAIVVCAVLCLLLLLVVLATIVDCVHGRRFSAAYSVNDTDDDEDDDDDINKGKKNNSIGDRYRTAGPATKLAPCCPGGLLNGDGCRMNGAAARNGASGQTAGHQDEEKSPDEKRTDTQSNGGDKIATETHCLMKVKGQGHLPCCCCCCDHALQDDLWGHPHHHHHHHPGHADAVADDAGAKLSAGDGGGDVTVVGDAVVRAVTVTVTAETKKKEEEGAKMDGPKSGSHQDHPDLPLWLRVARAFSLPVTLSRLLSTAESGNENVPCLHGIRVLTMLWVILANTVIFSTLFFENLMNAADQLISLPAQIVVNSGLSQDTFFLLSGVVTALTFLKSVRVNGGVRLQHMLYYYIHRLIRIWPAYILILVVCACLLGYVADGPHWPPPLYAHCRQQWWANLLFINNYFVSVEYMCMSWSWFLSCLMQFYWIAPLVLLPWAFGLTVVGFLVAGLLVVVHLVSTALLEVDVNADFLRRQSEYLWRIYQQPYCRVAPFAVGLMLGFVLTRVRFHFHITKVAACACWLTCLSVSTLLAFVTYEENQHLLVDASGWSLEARALHETAQRPLWACVVAWVVFACSTGNGGVVAKVLSWRGFLPLSRLTYCVYLVHPLLIQCDLVAYRVFPYFTMAFVVFRYVSYVVISYLLALVLNILSESPALALERTFISVVRSRGARGGAATAASSSPLAAEKA